MQIFISYASEQKAIADMIALALRERGHSVFFDRDDLPPGDGFSACIEENIKDSDLMVFLISPESVQPGRFTLTELNLARKYWRSAKRKLLPVMIAPTDLNLVPAFAKSVSFLTPQGNIAAEVASEVDELRGIEYAITVGLWVSAIAFAFGLLSFFSFNLDGAARWHAELPGTGINIPAPEVGLLFSIPIGIAIWQWGLRRWWAFLIPLVIVTVCYWAIAPQISYLTYKLAHGPSPEMAQNQQKFQQIVEKYHIDATGNETDKSFLDGMRERVDFLNISLMRIKHGLISGAVMALGTMLSLGLVMSQFRSGFRWLVVLVLGAAISGVDAFIVLYGGQLEFHRWKAMLLIIVWQVVFGALLGYWLARGRTTVSG